MSKVVTKCPGCGAVLSVRAEAVGRKAKCPKCQQIVRLLASTQESSSQLPQSEKKRPAAVSPQSTSSAPPTTPSVADRQPVAPSTPAAAAPAEKPVVPMAKVLSPTAGPAPGSPPQPGSPTAGPSANSGPAGEIQPFLSADLAPGDKFSPASLAAGSLPDAEIPRVKFRRRRSNPWPVVLLGIGALAVLALVVTLIVLLQQMGGRSAAGLPEIQFVNDAEIAVGQTVRIPISVIYPPQYSSYEKRQWKLQPADQNPPGVEWDTASGHLSWSPGTRDAGKSHLLSMQIENPDTREINLASFQVHVAALKAPLMAVVNYWDGRDQEVTLSLPSRQESRKADLIEVTVNGQLVRVFAFEAVEPAREFFQGLDPEEIDDATIIAGLAPPWRAYHQGSLVLITSTTSLEHEPAVKQWLEPQDPPAPE